MSRFSRRLIAAASQVQNSQIRTRMVAFSKELRELEKRREAVKRMTKQAVAKAG